MKRLILLSLFLSLAFVGRSWAQGRAVSGKVLDASTNEGLPGASVLVKGTSLGTATNADGNYTLQVPDDATTLVFKQLGYNSTERPIGASKTVDVALTVDTKQLNEVVVTALGIKREERALGYAVTEIKPEQVQQKSEPDVLRTLAGKIPGVNISSVGSTPGASTRITIRGNSSLQRVNGPLFVVDGIPYDNQQFSSASALGNSTNYSNRVADIDPNNIASMTVLKGAAAAALYGSRAAGGVVVITTRSGSGSKGPKGVQVGYSTSYSFEKVAGLPKYQNSYGSGTQFFFDSTGTGYNGSWGPKFGNTGNPQAPATRRHPQAGNPDFPSIGDDARIPYQAYPDNVKDFFNTGHVYENSLSLNGSSENATFSAVLSRVDQTGIIPGSSFVRNSIGAGGSGTFNKLTVGGNVTYTNTTQQGPQVGGSSTFGSSGNSVLARLLFMPRDLDLQGLPYINPTNYSSVFAWPALSDNVDNPLWSVENNKYTSRVDRVVASANASYAFKEWLTLRYIGGVNTYTDIRRTTLRPGGTGTYSLSGNIIEDNLQNTELDQTVLLGFDKNITEDINIRASVGQNLNQRQTAATSFQGTGIIVRGIDNIGNTTTQRQNGQYPTLKRRLMGVLGDVTIGYKDWAFLTATGRNDWSSTLNKNGESGNPGGSYFYSSLNGSFIFTEAFKLNYPWLRSGKIRANFGRVGYDATPYVAGPTRYSNNPAYGVGGAETDFPIGTSTALRLSSALGNAGLTPEFTNEVEIGTDLSFLKDRISVSASFYDRRTTHQIADITLPSATGFSAYTTNFGEISNKGVEVGFTMVPLDTHGFRWTSTTNFTHNRNIVEKLTAGLEQLVIDGYFTGSTLQPVLQAGQPYGEIFGTTVARDEQGNRLIDPSTGRMIIDPTPRPIGNPSPQFMMGIINQFAFKGFTLNTVIDYRRGGSIYSTTLMQELGRGVTKDTEDREKLVMIKGVQGDPTTRQPLRNADGSTIPNNTAITLNDFYFGSGSAALSGADEMSVYDATTVRLREITLGYDIPKKLIEKTPFGSFNVSLSGRNLYWYCPNIPKYTNFDPETGTYGTDSNIQGFELTNAPSTRRYGINLRVTF